MKLWIFLHSFGTNLLRNFFKSLCWFMLKCLFDYISLIVIDISFHFINVLINWIKYKLFLSILFFFIHNRRNKLSYRFFLLMLCILRRDVFASAVTFCISIVTNRFIIHLSFSFFLIRYEFIYKLMLLNLCFLNKVHLFS